MLTVGYLIELVALVLLGLTWIAHTHVMTEYRSWYGGPGYQSALNAITVVIALGFLSSSVIVVRGRTLQASVQRGRELRGPLFGAAVFAWLQCLTTFTAVALILDTTVGDRWVSRDYSNLWPVFLLSAVLLRWFAEMSSLAALGPVSGAMPSHRLAFGVSRATTENQPLWAVGTVFVVILALTQTQLFRGVSGATRAYGIVVMVASGFVLLLVSTLVNWSLYSAARRAVAGMETVADRSGRVVPGARSASLDPVGFLRPRGVPPRAGSSYHVGTVNR